MAWFQAIREFDSLYPCIMKWPTTSEQHSYMRMRQEQNLVLCNFSSSENWMLDKLLLTKYKFKRQAQWGYRLFDFWCHPLGIAIEIDGPEHNKEYDRIRDEYNYLKSGILVLRVRNMNDDDAILAIEIIESSCSWNERRDFLGLKPITT